MNSTPVELGISLNSTWMKNNNISDVNVYFKDPVNSVRFIAPKVHSGQSEKNVVFKLTCFQFKVYDERFVENYETVFSVKTSINQKLRDVDNCDDYDKRLIMKYVIETNETIYDSESTKNV